MITITRVPAGVMVSGPQGFQDIVYEKTFNALTEIKKRINYVREETVYLDEERKIIPFPVCSETK